MNTKYVAAIEIGSTKIKGIVASVESPTDINVLAIENTDIADIVRYGRVQNETEVSVTINEIIRRLENNQRLRRGSIKHVFVGEGGRSVCSFRAEATISQRMEASITNETLERLKSEARHNLATNRHVIAVMPRRYFVDNAEVKKIVGVFGNVIKGEFTIVTASPENRNRLDRVRIESHGETISRSYIPRTVALAEATLTDDERQLGCALVDFGAETTTIAVYRDNALQMLTTMPMGSRNINYDLCAAGMGITAENAETIKISKGEAFADRVLLDRLEGEDREINGCISARTGEIIANIVNQLEISGFTPQELSAGIVLAGGGSRLKGFIEMLEKQTGFSVRRAKVDPAIHFDNLYASDNIDILSLVKYAASNFDIDCIEFPADENENQTLVIETPDEELNDVEPQKSKGGFLKRILGKPKQRDTILDDDPEDPDYDPAIEEDLSDALPPEGPTPGETRRRLLEKIKNYIAPPVDDDGLDDEDDEK